MAVGECTLVPVFGSGERSSKVPHRSGFCYRGTSAKPALLETTLLRTPENWEKKKKTINIKKFGGTPHFRIWTTTIQWTCAVRLSHGSVPSVLRTFCPIYVELHINQVGTSPDVPGFPPPNPRDTSEAHRLPNSIRFREEKGT